MQIHVPCTCSSSIDGSTGLEPSTAMRLHDYRTHFADLSMLPLIGTANDVALPFDSEDLNEVF